MDEPLSNRRRRVAAGAAAGARVRRPRRPARGAPGERRGEHGDTVHLTFSPDTLRLYDAQSHAALGVREA
jgi:hypothetical protein